MDSSSEAQGTDQYRDGEARVNFRKSKSGRLEFLIDKIDINKDEISVATESDKSIGIEKVLNSFVGSITSTMNTFHFLNKLNNESVDHVINHEFLPHIKGNGVNVDPEKGYDEAYKIDFTAFESQQNSFKHIGRALETRKALGPMFLLSITARYDVLISDLIRIILRKYPGILDNSEKTFTLSDLRRIGSVEEAEKQLIDREVESIMFGSHKSQIDWFDKRTSEKITPLLNSISVFCEIFERRNLCAHTSLVVNERYVSNCQKFGVDSGEVPKKGDRLSVSSKYINKSAELLIQYGVIIAQSVWKSIHKKDKAELLSADKALLRHAKSIAGSQRFKLAASLLEVGLNKLVPATDLNKKEMIIALAECNLRDGKGEVAKKIVSEHDWSSSNVRMNIMSSAILENFETVIKLMDISKIESSIRPEEYTKSAVFTEARSLLSFQQKFKLLYGREISAYDKENIIGGVDQNIDSSDDGQIEKTQITDITTPVVHSPPVPAPPA